MSGLSFRTSVILLAVVALAGGGWWLAGGAGAETRAPAVDRSKDAKQVALRISIKDEDSGLSVEVTRKVPQGVTALEAMQMTVAIETKEYAGLGLFVTKLCGSAPAAGKFWSPAIDGQKSKVGVAKLTIDQDTLLSWTIRDVKSSE